MKKIPIIPDCYKDLPDSTNLNSKEVAKMFGYASAHSFTAANNKLIVPKHDIELLSDCGQTKSGKKASYYWKLGTIRKWKNNNSI